MLHDYLDKFELKLKINVNRIAEMETYGDMNYLSCLIMLFLYY